MRTATLLIVLCLATAATAEDPPPLDYSPVRGGFEVVRRGCGTRIYHGRHRGFADGSLAEFTGVAGAPWIRVAGEACAFRGSKDEEYRGVRGSAVLLFPELFEPNVLAPRVKVVSRKRLRGGLTSYRLEPIAKEDGEIVSRVYLRVGEGGAVARVRILFPNGDRETREYRPEDVEIVKPAAPEPIEATVDWPPEATVGSPLTTALEALRRKAGEVRDIRGRFVRTKKTILLMKPSTVSGEFRYVTDRLLWIDEKPREARVLITRRQMGVYDPANRRLERFSFAGSELSKYVFLGFGDSISEGLSSLDPVVFVMEESKTRLELVPPPGHALARHLRRLVLEFDGESGLLRLMAYEDPDGDSVSTVLSEVKRNTGLTKEDVDIDPAPGTRVIEHERELPWR